MVDPTRCGEVADALAEVATGAASGPDRARVLAHLADCPDCRRELEELTRVADEVLLVAPEHDPPAGFEGAVLARIAALTADEPDALETPAEPEAPPAAEAAPAAASEAPAEVAEPDVPPAAEPSDAVVTPLRPRRWRRVLPYAAAAAIAALGGAGVVWQATSEDRDLAAGYRETLDVANGRYFHAAPLLDDAGAQVGHVFLYQGEPSWVFTVLGDTAAPGTYDVSVVTEDGAQTIADYEVGAAGGGSGGTVDTNIYEIRRVDLIGSDGVTYSAELSD
ncbi:anti-sigma factor family protein [Jiangella alba]|uniref:Putative zinc-finger n=1 Tax=Jiangella alba TaxID=561176 RepID=A0A1H5PEL4_9ACTN|nr:zf-HC2 domain-containing protein [Jiangella alba]SEF12216.1 Putative zinc-finger [Jiangella alba]